MTLHAVVLIGQAQAIGGRSGIQQSRRSLACKRPLMRTTGRGLRLAESKTMMTPPMTSINIAKCSLIALTVKLTMTTAPTTLRERYMSLGFDEEMDPDFSFRHHSVCHRRLQTAFRSSHRITRPGIIFKQGESRRGHSSEVVRCGVVRRQISASKL